MNELIDMVCLKKLIESLRGFPFNIDFIESIVAFSSLPLCERGLNWFCFCHSTIAIGDSCKKLWRYCPYASSRERYSS